MNNVQVDATASYDLQFGVDLSGATPTAFILDDTNIGINLTVIGDDLDFTAALGPLGVTVIDGSVTLDGDGNPLTDDAATYSFDLIDDAGDGLYLVSELDTSIVAEQTDGVLNVDLPLFYPTASNPLGGTAAGGANVLSVDVADLGALFDDAAGSVAISTPDLVPQIALNDLLNDPNVVRAGIEGFFTQLADSIAPLALAVRIPIIGDGLSAIDELFDDLRDAAINAFNAGFDDSGGPLDPVQAVSRIQDALFAAFSSGGLALLDDLNEDGVVDADDIQIVGDGDHVQFDVSLHQDLLTLSADLDFDIGLPSLEAFFNFESSGSATLEAGYDMDFRFGVDLTDGFYVDTSEDDEISISVEARIPNFSATVNLLLLGGDAGGQHDEPLLLRWHVRHRPHGFQRFHRSAGCFRRSARQQRRQVDGGGNCSG